MGPMTGQTTEQSAPRYLAHECVDSSYSRLSSITFCSVWGWLSWCPGPRTAHCISYRRPCLESLDLDIEWTTQLYCLWPQNVKPTAARPPTARTGAIFGPILWSHSGPLCHALSLSLLSLSSSLSWTSMRRRRAAAGSGEWAKHFSNASCFTYKRVGPSV